MNLFNKGALKSFTLKQFDLIRKTIFQEAARGNYAKAGYNAVRYLTFVTGLNTGVDTVKRFMHGKEVGMEEFKDDYVNNALKILGASKKKQINEFLKKYQIMKKYLKSDKLSGQNILTSNDSAGVFS